MDKIPGLCLIKNQFTGNIYNNTPKIKIKNVNSVAWEKVPNTILRKKNGFFGRTKLKSRPKIIIFRPFLMYLFL